MRVQSGWAFGALFLPLLFASGPATATEAQGEPFTISASVADATAEIGLQNRTGRRLDVSVVAVEGGDESASDYEDACDRDPGLKADLGQWFCVELGPGESQATFVPVSSDVASFVVYAVVAGRGLDRWPDGFATTATAERKVEVPLPLLADRTATIYSAGRPANRLMDTPGVAWVPTLSALLLIASLTVISRMTDRPFAGLVLAGVAGIVLCVITSANQWHPRLGAPWWLGVGALIVIAVVLAPRAAPAVEGISVGVAALAVVGLAFSVGWGWTLAIPGGDLSVPMSPTCELKNPKGFVAAENTVPVQVETGCVDSLAVLSVDERLLVEGRTYQGAVDLRGDTEGGDVALTIVATWAPWAPVIALVLSIAAAIWFKWLKDLSPASVAWPFQERLHRIVRDAVRVDRRVRGWRISGGIDMAAQGLIASLKTLIDSVGTKARLLADQSYRDLESDVDKLELAVRGWADLEPKLESVARWIESPDGWLESMALTERIQTVLEPNTELSVADTRWISEEIPIAARIAESWADVLSDLQQIATWAGRLASSPQAPGTQVDEALRSWTQFRTALESEESPAAVLLLIEDDLHEVRELLKAALLRLTMEGSRSAVQRRNIRESSDLERLLDSLLGAPSFERVASEEGSEDERREFGLRRNFVSGLLFSVVAVFAVATGLAALYVGKPFGTGWDWLGLVVWGLGGGVAIDLVGDALARFRDRPEHLTEPVAA